VQCKKSFLPIYAYYAAVVKSMRKPRDRVLGILENKPVEEVPVFPLIGFHSAVLFGVELERSVKDPGLMAEIQVRAAEYYNVDGVTPIMDLSLEPEALGTEVKYFKGVPSVSKHLPLEELSKLLDKKDYLSAGRIPVFLEAVKRISSGAKDRLVCAYVEGPLTLLTQVFSVERVFVLARKDPLAFENALNFTTRLQLELVDAYTERGAECVIVLEPVGALVPPSLFERYLISSLNTLISRAKSRGTKAILHICGDARKVFREMLKTSADALSVDKYINLAEALKVAEGKALMGNISTTDLLLKTPGDISSQVLEVLMATGGRVILSTGCEISPNTPPPNIKALVETARRFKPLG
jgi:MtaA/CmuA family methyltransferase